MVNLARFMTLMMRIWSYGTAFAGSPRVEGDDDEEDVDDI